MGDIVEEVGQALDVHADAPRIPGNAPGHHAETLELAIELALIAFSGHESSMATPGAWRSF